jgi:hypothetical protein
MIPRSLLLILFSIITSCSSSGRQTTETPKSENQIVIDCSIFSPNGELIRTFPGSQCRFLPDGRWISRDPLTRELILHDTDFKELWRIKAHFHHILTITNNNQILALGSSVHKFRKKLTRFDVLMRINKEGDILARYDFFKNQNEILKKSNLQESTLYPFDWDNGPLPNVHWEFSHANSIYEIPENPTASQIPAFKKGNIVINVMGLDTIFILDPLLNHIVWSFRFTPDSGKSLALNHDVQVLPNGHLLIYVNQVLRAEKTFSTLIEYDPVKAKTIWSYEANPLESFSSKICGGVQVLENNNVFFSDITNGSRAIEINRDGKRVRSISVESKSIQDAKRENLNDFLNKSQRP